jgi:hypothetical protein
MSTTETKEITPVEYARTFGVTIGYVYSQIWDGRLPARKSYGRWMIPASSVAERQARIGSRENVPGEAQAI